MDDSHGGARFPAIGHSQDHVLLCPNVTRHSIEPELAEDIVNRRTRRAEAGAGDAGTDWMNDATGLGAIDSSVEL